MYSPLLLRIAHLVLTKSILRILMHSLLSEPVHADFLDPGTSSTASGNSLDQGSWLTDSSTDADLLLSLDYPDVTTSDDTDLFLAGNGPCHSDANLSQFDAYSKLRIRQACDTTEKPNPAPALPTLDEFPTNSEDESIGVEELTTGFNIMKLQQSVTDENGHDRTCPEDKTFFSKVPVCDSGKMTDTEGLRGVPYSTLYNVQPCSSIRPFYWHFALINDADGE
jgi:hypothetical protein